MPPSYPQGVLMISNAGYIIILILMLWLFTTGLPPAGLIAIIVVAVIIIVLPVLVVVCFLVIRYLKAHNGINLHTKAIVTPYHINHSDYCQ